MPASAQREMSAATAATIEYSIYTFNKDDRPGSGKWQKHDVLHDMTLAVQKAESLFKSGDYSRVEIKQKYTDAKNGRSVDMSLKVFERKGARGLSATMIVILAAIGGVAAFAATYIMNGGLNQ